MSTLHPERFLRGLFDIAVESANPSQILPPHLPLPPTGRTLVLSAGKAAASMARAVETLWLGDLSGLAVTRYGHGVECEHIEVIEAGHPLPDDAGHGAARRFLALADGLGKDDLLLFLISGGASALLVEPPEGLGLNDKRLITHALLESGAPIDEINCVRKHLSAIKGGRLAAAAYPARVATLAISDVPYDDPTVIGSGPTTGDPTTCADALAIADHRAIRLPEHVRRALSAGSWETIKPDDPLLANAYYRLVAGPAGSQKAAANAAESAQIKPMLLGANLEGEARDVGYEHAGIARAAPPGVILSGGETTVTLKGRRGRGGRNCEYLLALAIALEGAPGIHAIACDTDGIDGTEDAAGAHIRPDTLMRAASAGLNPFEMLEEHDSFTFFEKLDDLIWTGPTRTNVNDFRAIMVTGR